MNGNKYSKQLRGAKKDSTREKGNKVHAFKIFEVESIMRRLVWDSKT